MTTPIVCSECGLPIVWDAAPRDGERHAADLRADRHQGWVHLDPALPGWTPALAAVPAHPASPWPAPLREERPAGEVEAVITSARGDTYRIVGRLEEDGRLHPRDLGPRDPVTGLLLDGVTP